MSRRTAIAIVALGGAVIVAGVALVWIPAAVVLAGAGIAALGLLADYRR